MTWLTKLHYMIVNQTRKWIMIILSLIRKTQKKFSLNISSEWSVSMVRGVYFAQYRSKVKVYSATLYQTAVTFPKVIFNRAEKCAVWFIVGQIKQQKKYILVKNTLRIEVIVKAFEANRLDEKIGCEMKYLLVISVHFTPLYPIVISFI